MNVGMLLCLIELQPTWKGCGIDENAIAATVAPGQLALVRLHHASFPPEVTNELWHCLGARAFFSLPLGFLVYGLVAQWNCLESEV